MSNLVGNIRSSITDIAVHLAHDTNVFIGVEQGVFLLSLGTRSVSTIDGLVSLETGIGQDDNQALGVLVGRGNWSMLLCDELWKVWRRERLGSCHCADDQLQSRYYVG